MLPMLLYLRPGVKIIKIQGNYNVVIYCRLSRDDERAGESVSIESQREGLGKYVHEQGWNFISTYCNNGNSGSTFDRSGFKQLIEASKYTDVVFPTLGFRFIALNDDVDTIRKNNEMLVILKYLIMYFLQKIFQRKSSLHEKSLQNKEKSPRPLHPTVTSRRKNNAYRKVDIYYRFIGNPC